MTEVHHKPDHKPDAHPHKPEVHHKAEVPKPREHAHEVTKDEPDKPDYPARVPRARPEAQGINVQTITGPATQDAPTASFDVTVKLSDAVGKVLMDATPSVKMLNGTVKLDVNEVNPVHLLPGQFRVNLQQALTKMVAKDEVVTFEY